MHQDEAKHAFAEADRRFRAGDHAGALVLLNQLDQAFPNTKNILYPKALCLMHLNQLDEADAIGLRLEQEIHDIRAPQLREEIAQKRQAAVSDIVIPNLDDFDFASPAIPAMPKPQVQEKPNYLKWTAIGLGIVLLAIIIVVPLATYDADEAARLAAERTDAAASSTPGVGAWIVVCGLVAFSFVILPVPLYLTLLLVNKLPYGSFGADYWNTMGYSLILFLLSFIPCIGLIIGIVILVKKYEMGFLDIVVLIVINLAIGAVYSFIFYSILFAALGPSYFATI